MIKQTLKKLVIILLVCLFVTSSVSCTSSKIAKNGKQDEPSSTPAATAIPGSEQKPGTPQATPAAPNNENAAPVNKPSQKRVKAKGLYLTATSAGARLDYFVNLANTTEINSFVIDVKNDYGTVCHASEVPLANEIGAVEKRYDAEKVIKELHDNDIYAIARIVCFKDPILSKNRPDMAIKNKEGGLYVHNKMTWVNPYNRDSWQYSIDLAKEALAKGFDEIQFDYIRFPDGKKSEMVFGNTGDQKYYEVINEFLAYARQQLPDAVISGDIFAIICESPGDREGIGQYFEYIGKDLDYLCPMAYPSHYAPGQIINGVKFPKPDMDPYGVIKNTLLKAKARMEKVEGNKPVLRTYLQDFTATWIGKGNWQYYEDAQVRQQIQAVYDAGYEEWILWDPMNKYREGALKKEP
jgi:hypothetical protein